MNLEILRKKLFWSLDFLNGKKIANNYKDIKKILETSSQIESKKLQEKHLIKLLNHAVSSTSFYKKNKNFKSIENFPIINKNLIRDNYSKFKSEKYLTKKVLKVSTSGSTGTPFTILHNINKKNRNTADTIYFAEKVGYNLGAKLFYIRMWNVRLRKNEMISWFQNIVKHSVFDLDDKGIAILLKKIEKYKFTKLNILSYASAYETICRHLDKIKYKPIKNNIQSIISMSESLNEYTKKAMYKYFGMMPISRYSNIENGILAQQINDDTGYFYINEASYYIEILDINEDKPVRNGKLGRIVVTDFFNYAMPMIRYDTGDIGAVKIFYDKKNKPLVFTTVSGRKLDLIFDTKDNIISPDLIDDMMGVLSIAIKQYQFVQSDKNKYVYKLNCDTKLLPDNEESVIKKFKTFLGNDAEVNIEYVDEIPLLSSGKRKAILNTYKNTI